MQFLKIIKCFFGWNVEWYVLSFKIWNLIWNLKILLEFLLKYKMKKNYNPANLANVFFSELCNATVIYWILFYQFKLNQIHIVHVLKYFDKIKFRKRHYLWRKKIVYNNLLLLNLIEMQIFFFISLNLTLIYCLFK